MKVDITKLTKRYYTISEVSKMFDLTKSSLRYWEGEFKEIQPRKDRGGIRRYTIKDIEVINQIHALVKERGFTIDGARKELQLPHENPDKEIKEKLLKALNKLKELRSRL